MITDDIGDPLFFEVGGAPAIGRLYSDRVSYSMWSMHFFSFMQIHTIGPFDSYLVGVDRIGRCTCSRHIVPYYTASMNVHCFLVAILFTLWWHLSAMLLPLGTCVHRSWSWIPQSFRKHSNCLLQKAISLSQSGRDLIHKTLTLTGGWHWLPDCESGGFAVYKHKEMLAAVMCYIHTQFSPSAA